VELICDLMITCPARHRTKHGKRLKVKATVRDFNEGMSVYVCEFWRELPGLTLR